MNKLRRTVLTSIEALPRMRSVMMTKRSSGNTGDKMGCAMSPSVFLMLGFTTSRTIMSIMASMVNIAPCGGAGGAGPPGADGVLTSRRRARTA